MKPLGRWMLTVVMSATAVGAGALAFHLAQRSNAPADVPATLATPATTPLDPDDAPHPGIRPATLIPEQLPAFTLPDPAGQPTPIARWQGKALMINFWATWCPPCRREIPLLQSLHREFRDGDFEVLGIAVDHAEQVRGFRDQYRITYPLLVGEQDALDLIARLGVATPAFPFTVFTDRQGRIVTLYLGELKRPVATAILATVAQVNRGHLDLAAARARIETEVSALRAAAQQASD